MITDLGTNYMKNHNDNLLNTDDINQSDDDLCVVIRLKLILVDSMSKNSIPNIQTQIVTLTN